MKEYRRLCQEVRCFLTKSSPVAETRQSLLPGAGTGLFAKKQLRKDEVLTLYPGVYTPGLPSTDLQADVDNIAFLGGQITPSGKVAEDNAYILNLRGNGYIDGLALTSQDGRQLDGPYALGHLVNHQQLPNVYVSPFCWSDVDQTFVKDIPNVIRCDYSPRCLIGNQVILYDTTNATIYGAAVCAATDISCGQELFMDYELSKPYPKWASDWYNGTSA